MAKPSHRVFSITVAALCAWVVAGLFDASSAAPIQKIEGIITEVGEGYLWLKPEGEEQGRRFILQWKARFDPPKLPLKGDYVEVLYKLKEEGAVIYGVRYVRPFLDPGSSRGTGGPDTKH
ncbi:MAG: hypothetical protein V2B18_03725 [Pseudomonadota bacterium]